MLEINTYTLIAILAIISVIIILIWGIINNIDPWTYTITLVVTLLFFLVIMLFLLSYNIVTCLNEVVRFSKKHAKCTDAIVFEYNKINVENPIILDKILLESK